MKKFLFILAMVTLIFPTAAFSTPYSIDNFPITTAIGSSDMDGMEVTITWSGGGQTTASWNSGVSGTGSTGDNWRLNFTGFDTSTMKLEWELFTDRAIDSFTINAVTGNVFFDIIEDGTTGNTSGSLTGFWGPNADTWNPAASAMSGTTNSTDSTFLKDYGAQFYWEFSNPGYLSTASSFPDPAIDPHDLFSMLYIDFLDGSGNDSTFTGTFNMGVDTDKVEGVSPVPEPAAMLLFGLGLLGISAAGRRKV